MRSWKMAAIICFVHLLAISSGTSKESSHARNASRTLEASDRIWIAETLKRLSLEEKIGQMLQLRVYGDYPSFNDPAYRASVEQIHKYHVGSVDLGARMVGPNLVKGTPSQVATVTNQLQRETDVPLLVGADIERGLASRLSGVPEFPFPMAFGATADPDLVEQFALISAQEARAVGIHWAFAPVTDVNSNPANPIINVRSYGEDPHDVAKFVAAYIRGAHRGGLLVAPKHFPGHGDSSTDSHLGVVKVSSDRRHLETCELVPFKAAIDAGADSVLLAHAAVPALDPDDHRITTNSPKIVTELLEKQMGFDGVVVTDALEMRGLLNLYPHDSNPSGHAAVDAIRAGADVLMLPKDLAATFRAILDAVRGNEISKDRIDLSVRKILRMKALAGLNTSRFVDLALVEQVFPDVQSNNIAQQVADRAITLVRSNGLVLPLRSRNGRSGEGRRLAQNQVNSLVVVSFIDSSKNNVGFQFDQQVILRRSDAKIFHYYNDRIGLEEQPSDIIAAVKKADQVVVAAFVSHVPGRQVLSHGSSINAVGLMGEAAKLLGEIIDGAAEKSVLVSIGSPYTIEDYPKTQNYICTYSLVPTAELSAARALFGEIQNHAKLPVTLPDVAPAGYAIAWPKAENGETK
jgi:beta-N-acetylhexosaminidase